MSRLVKHVRSFSNASWSKRRCVIEAVVLFYVFRFTLWIIPFKKIRPLLGTPGPMLTSEQRQASRCETIAGPARQVSDAMRLVSRSKPDTCLAQALAGRVMLRRRRLTSTLWFGTRSENDKLHFHAWLVHEGKIITGGGGLRRYKVLSVLHDTRP